MRLTHLYFFILILLLCTMIGHLSARSIDQNNTNLTTEIQWNYNLTVLNRLLTKIHLPNLFPELNSNDSIYSIRNIKQSDLKGDFSFDLINSNDSIYLLSSFGAKSNLTAHFVLDARSSGGLSKVHLKIDYAIDRKFDFAINNILEFTVENVTIDEIESAEQSILSFVGGQIWTGQIVGKNVNKKLAIAYIKPIKEKFLIGIGGSDVASLLIQEILNHIRMLGDYCENENVQWLNEFKNITGMATNLCSIKFYPLKQDRSMVGSTSVIDYLINNSVKKNHTILATYKIVIYGNSLTDKVLEVFDSVQEQVTNFNVINTLLGFTFSQFIMIHFTDLIVYSFCLATPVIIVAVIWKFL